MVLNLHFIVRVNWILFQDVGKVELLDMAGVWFYLCNKQFKVKCSARHGSFSGVPVLRRLEQGGHELQFSLGYKPCLEKKVQRGGTQL